MTVWFAGDEGEETSTCELEEAEESGGSAVEKGFSSSNGSMAGQLNCPDRINLGGLDV